MPSLATRLSRRRMLQSTLFAAGGLTAAALVGCESDSTSPPAATATMPPPSGTFDSNGVPIHYEVFSEGYPIVLVHGFSVNFQLNWVASGWVDELTPIRQVVGLDARGHGESGKPHEPEAYANDAMPNDVIGLMDHLGIERADLFGYSMGAGISLRLLVNNPDRFSSVVLGGIGEFARGADGGGGGGSLIAEALLAEDPETIESPIARGFRTLADALGNDNEALAAYMLSTQQTITDEALGQVTLPVLVVNGENDDLVGPPDALAAAIPTAELAKIPGTDHLTTVSAPAFKETVIDFLNRRSPA
ncbi:MAG: alpha/beta hydrolase [Chloroflexi bacterium]|nr:alpha/beta hydrolase [Chloroflexota bacterium]